MAGTEKHPVQVRRKSFSGPIAGGLQVACAGPRTLTALTTRAFIFGLPYAARIAAIGWFTEQTAVTVATLNLTTAALPSGTVGQLPLAHLVSTGVQAAVDLVVNPTGIIVLNDTTGKEGTSYLSSTVHAADSGNDTTAGGIWVRSGVGSFTGTSMNFSVQVYYWPTEHVYTDKGFD